MARPKTPKQLEIKIKSLRKQVSKLEMQKKRALAMGKKAKKKKVVKRRVVKKKAVRKKVAKRKRR